MGQATDNAKPPDRNRSPYPRVKGSVEILCAEIGFRFERPMERPEVLVSFVAVLVGVLSEIHQTQQHIAKLPGVLEKAPSVGSAQAIECANSMVSASTREALISAAADLHALCRELNPEETYPTDHLIDMASSCASAVRCGLEMPSGLGSRHAAEAASHIWRHRYGVTLEDSYTPRWRKDWACAMFERALLRLALNSLKHSDD